MSYGKHQSFYIKKNWITKGINAISDFGFDFFFNTDNYMKIGVGKNMFESIRFWLESANIVKVVDKKHEFTVFGKYILSKDPSCSKNFTLLLIHYYLVSESKSNKIDKLDTFYWYFNLNNEEILTTSRRSAIIDQWALEKKVSPNTLKRDFECLIALYTKHDILHPEDKNISLLSPLRLMSSNSHFIEKMSLKESYYNYYAFMYILLNMAKDNSDLNLGKVISDPGSLGKVFNLNASIIVEIIDTMITSRFSIDFTRTNNINTIRIIERMKSEEYLNYIIEKGLV